MSIHWLPALLLASLLSTPCAYAQTRQPLTEGWTFNLYFENDLFAETDQNYTNGVRLSWVSPDLSDFLQDPLLPPWVRDLNRSLTFFHDGSAGLQRNLVLSLGQTIYTPRDIKSTALLPDQRPYAGWLYAGVAYHTKNHTALDTVELAVGLVGPWALGEQAQDLIHDLRGFEKFQGWDNQLDNELGIVLLYEHKDKLIDQVSHRSGGFGYDLIGHAGASLGNVATYVNMGAEFRIGWDIPADFGTSAVRPGGDNSAPDSVWDPRLTRQKVRGIHAFASLDGRWVLRDIFLDGNTFSDSHSVAKEPLVADLSLGLSTVINRYKLSFARVYRTREFKQQLKSHAYGSFSVSYSF